MSIKNETHVDPYYDLLMQDTYIREDYRLDRGSGLIQILNFPENPELPADATELESALFNVRSYLHTVTQNQSCPYVGGIEKRKGYYVYPVFREANDVFLECVAGFIRSSFRLLELEMSMEERRGSKPVNDQTTYLTTMASFHHPDNLTPSFCRVIDEFRDIARLSFLEEGLMFSQMHPFHPRESLRPKRTDGILYSSGVPLLMVRKMHRRDHVFMKTEEEMEAYREHFPPDDEVKN